MYCITAILEGCRSAALKLDCHPRTVWEDTASWMHCCLNTCWSASKTISLQAVSWKGTSAFNHPWCLHQKHNFVEYSVNVYNNRHNLHVVESGVRVTSLDRKSNSRTIPDPANPICSLIQGSNSNNIRKATPVLTGLDPSCEKSGVLYRVHTSRTQ